MDRMASAPGPYTVLRGHASDVQALTFLNDTLFFSGDAEGRVHLWDMEERRSVHTQALHGLLTGILYLQVVHIPKSGRLLISYGRDGMIKGWQIHGSGAPSSDFVQWLEGGAACVWDVCHDGMEVLKLSRPPLPGPNSGTNALGNSSRGMCMAVQLIPGASTSDWHLLSGYEDGSVAVWDLSSPQQPRADVRGVHSEPLLCLAANAHHCRSQYDGKQGQQVAAVSGGTDAHVACYALRCGAGSAGVGSNAVRRVLANTRN
ncbi:WD40-repeat-containing domain protein [Dunaliella salina]|uniref:WD40-repeat-containing domain protein n=1 Tax=Dunaliella salina TaxID=3046 RepID=A0ABQ7GAX6_DUNSA|nr:WD40-repeat-containing domain protein [Dunaliella salina]|eukprot:KAF5831765.1 WD40-repeat-containing domain protein [Dunaliella salina]